MRPSKAALLAVAAAVLASASARAETPEQSFIAGADLAMQHMMVGMSVKPSGDMDADFVALMEPHHQGAIEMAQLELRYGHNEQLRRIAQEIIVDQQQEIIAMRLALGLPSPPSEPAIDPSAPRHRH